MRLRPGFVSALALFIAAEASAQRVVILEIEGDKAGKLRNQVEAALKKADTVEVVSLEKYKAAAAKKKLKGAAAMTPAGFARVARSLKIDAGVGGELDQKFAVQIWDAQGQQLWTKELKAKNGLLSADFAGKLAKAITAAAKTAPAAEEETEGEGEEVATVKPKREPPSEEGSEEGRSPATGRREREQSEEERERKKSEEAAEEAAAQRVTDPDHDEDLQTEGKKVKNRVGPKGLSLWLSGTTTWRYYCARPGVDTCAEYDELVARGQPAPQGDIVDFKPQVPYAGFNINVELFPLAWVLENALQGLGVVGSFGLGFSLTNVTVESPSGASQPKQVVSTDRAWSAGLAYRYYFSFNSDSKIFGVGYAGLRVGAAGRVFEIDAKAQVPLPGANRVYPLVAIDVAIPIVKYIGVELSGSYFFGPKAGPDEVAGYGNSMDPSGGVNSSGFQLEGGLAGTIWGPVGYRLRLRWSPFSDKFVGQGQKWIYTDKGAAYESYTTLVWGITASF